MTSISRDRICFLLPVPSPSPSLHRRTVYVSALDRFLFFLQFAVISSLLIEKGVNITSGRRNTFRWHLLFSLAFSFVPFSHPRATAGDDDDLWFPINRGGPKNARSWPSELIADLHGESSVAVTRVSTAVDPTLRLLFRRRTRYLHWFT